MATDRLINSTQGDSIISELDNIADKIEGINRDIILPSNQINAMTGYSEPSGTSAITPSNTLNEAIGKLERKADNNTNNISSCKEFTDNAKIDSDRKLYISAIEPTGTIPTGSTWIDGKTIKTYSRTDNEFDKNNADVTTYSTLYMDGSVWRTANVETSRVIRIPCAASTEYTLSISDNIENTILRIASVSTATKPTADTPVSFTTIVNGGEIHNYTFTTAANAQYILVQTNGEGTITQDAIDTLMLNTGSTAKPYQPYYAWQ